MTIVINGTESLGQQLTHLLVMASRGGFPNISIASSPEKSSHWLEKDDQRFVDLMQTVSGNIRLHKSGSPVYNIYLIRGSPYNWLHSQDPTKIDAIVDASRDAEGKEDALKYGQSRSIPVILASASDRAVITLGKEYDFEEFEDAEQNPLTSSVAAGWIYYNLNQLLSREKGDQNFSRHFPEHFEYQLPFDADRLGELRGKKAAMVGAGALGNVIGPLLSQAGLELTVVDFDFVSGSNFEKQAAYSLLDTPLCQHIANYSKILVQREEELKKTGQEISEAELAKHRVILKAGAFAQVWGSYFNSKINPINARVASEEQLADLLYETKSEVLSLAVDHDPTRKIGSRAAVAARIPVVDTAISPTGGNVVNFYPGGSACLEHKMPYSAPAAIACTDVLGSAKIIGSVAAAETLANLLGNPLVGGRILFSSVPHDIKMQLIAETCGCVQGSYDKTTARLNLERRGFEIYGDFAGQESSRTLQDIKEGRF